MRSLLIVIALSLSSSAASTGTPAKTSAKAATAKVATQAAPASKDGWPDTPAGAMGRRWVTAFSAGEPAFRAFLESELSQESLEKKPISERLKVYRDNHERYGTLTLGSIVKSSPGELTASLLDADLSPHEFTFTVHTEPPYKLKSVTAKQTVRSHGFGFHH